MWVLKVKTVDVFIWNNVLIQYIEYNAITNISIWERYSAALGVCFSGDVMSDDAVGSPWHQGDGGSRRGWQGGHDISVQKWSRHRHSVSGLNCLIPILAAVRKLSFTGVRVRVRVRVCECVGVCMSLFFFFFVRVLVHVHALPFSLNGLIKKRMIGSKACVFLPALHRNDSLVTVA